MLKVNPHLPVWLANQCYICFSEYRTVLLAWVLLDLQIQEGNKHCTLTALTHLMFVSLCANHMFVVGELFGLGGMMGSYYWMAAVDLTHRRHVENQQKREDLRNSFTIRKMLPCPNPCSQVTDLWPLQWCFQGHLTCFPPIVCGFFFLTWLYHFLLSIKNRKRQWRKKKRLLMLLMILFSDFVNCKLYFKINKIF